MKRVYDLAVKTGSYQTRDGKTKNSYENVGAVMEGDNGPFILFKKTFNPAGIQSDKDTIIISMFAPKEKENKIHGQTNINPFDEEQMPF